MSNSSKGIFTVGHSGQFSFDYLFDGGWWQGEIGVYNLSGMEAYTPGSVEYIQEASRRAISNSNEGYVVMSDGDEGAKYNATLSHERDFNQGDYSGKKTFSMTSGDRFGFIFTQNNALKELANTPENYTQPGKMPLFSIAEANPNGDAPEQFVTLDGNQIFGFEATRVDKSSWKNHDYNEAIFKVLGATGDAASYEDHATLTTNSVPDYNNFLKSRIGQKIVSETEVGVFTVGDSGQFSFDYLFDGGWWQGELGVYNLEDMAAYIPGSVEYIQEASRRAISNSNEGYVVMSDRDEGAKHSATLPWEGNFNKGEHLGEKTFSMSSGDRFGFIFTQDNALEELANTPENYTQPGKMPLFSIAEANPDGNAPQQFAALDRYGTFGFEATRVDDSHWSDIDYNEVVFRVLDATAEAVSYYDYGKLRHDYRNFLSSDIGQEIIDESKQKTEYKYRQKILNSESLTIGESGELIIDALYDGGMYGGEVGIFSLEGMEEYELKSSAFIQQAATRALSNCSQGYVVFQDSLEGVYYQDEENYQGSKTFELTPGGKYGLMFVRSKTIAQILENPSSDGTYFSMRSANERNAQQMVYQAESDNLTVVGMEDMNTFDRWLGDHDYDDLVFSIEGATLSASEYKEISWRWDKGLNPIASNDSNSTSKDTTVSIAIDTLLNNDYTFGNNINFEGFNADNTFGSLSIDGDRLVYNPDGQFDGLQTGETATDSFTYTISDRAGKIDTATVEISIEGFDDDRTLYGGTGDDSLIGGTGNDHLYGSSGDDTLTGSNGVDVLYGGAGDDSLIGGAGDDTLIGSSGDDTLTGSNGVDVLYGGAGDDSLIGGAGDDYLYGLEGDDIIDGGTGDDTLIGSSGDDTLTGSNGVDVLYGGAGDDSLIGGAGDDYLYGLEGDDIIDGGTGDDTLIGSSGHDTLSGSNGVDVLYGGAGDDIINGGNNHDTIITGDGNDIIVYSSKLHPSQEEWALYYEQYNNWYGYEFAKSRGRLDRFYNYNYYPSDNYSDYSYPNKWEADIDTIEDFTVGQDKINLSGVISGNPLDHSLVSLSGSNHASLSYDGYTVMTFQNVDASDLNDSSNFVF